MFFTCFHLHEIQRNIQRREKREKEREDSSTHLFASQIPAKQLWPGPPSGSGTWVAEAQVHKPSLSASYDILAGGGIRSRAIGTGVSHGKIQASEAEVNLLCHSIYSTTYIFMRFADLFRDDWYCYTANLTIQNIHSSVLKMCFSTTLKLSL